MVDVAKKQLMERDLPDNIDYYVIQSDGSVIESGQTQANVYIDEFDVKYFSDVETMLYVRKHYGRFIGVMRDCSYAVRPREYKTSKMLLGVVKGIPKKN